MADETKASNSKKVEDTANAGKPNETKATNSKKAIVIKEFRDKDNFATKFKLGQDVSHFDEVRIADLVSKKLVEVK